VEGKYDRALELPDVSALLALGETGFDFLMISRISLTPRIAESLETRRSRLKEYVSQGSDKAEGEVRQGLVLSCGVLALCIFVQANWTGKIMCTNYCTIHIGLFLGPELPESLSKYAASREDRQALLEELSLDGEVHTVALLRSLVICSINHHSSILPIRPSTSTHAT